MHLFLDRCVGNAPYAANDSARIHIARLQVIFPSIPSTSESSDSVVAMNVSSVESQPHRVATPPTLMTVLAQPTDHAEELLRIQRWDQARERRYQTIRALCLLMEVHDCSNEYWSRLATRSAPLSQGDNMQIMGRLFLTAEEVPPLVTDEDDGLTDWDAEGDMDKGED